MIYELFYPIELKGAIKLLQKEDALDNHGVHRINRFIQRHVIVVGVICALFVLMSLSFANTIVTVFFLFMCAYILGATILSIHRTLKNYPPMYSLGIKATGTVTRTLESGAIAFGAHSWGLDYKYVVNGKEYFGKKRNLGNYFKRDKYQKRQDIVVYYNPDDPSQSLPFISSVYPTFNLRKVSKDEHCRI